MAEVEAPARSAADAAQRRARLKTDVRRFLEDGGKIERLPFGVKRKKPPKWTFQL